MVCKKSRVAHRFLRRACAVPCPFSKPASASASALQGEQLAASIVARPLRSSGSGKAVLDSYRSWMPSPPPPHQLVRKGRYDTILGRAGDDDFTLRIIWPNFWHIGAHSCRSQGFHARQRALEPGDIARLQGRPEETTETRPRARSRPQYQHVPTSAGLRPGKSSRGPRK
jgi:hypothetical protein